VDLSLYQHNTRFRKNLLHIVHNIKQGRIGIAYIISLVAFHKLFEIMHAGAKTGGLMKTKGIVIGEKIGQPAGP
jgi:hypothetical protein